MLVNCHRHATEWDLLCVFDEKQKDKWNLLKSENWTQQKTSNGLCIKSIFRPSAMVHH